MPKLVIFLILYLIIGGKILLKAFRNISHGELFDENFLMCVATIGAFVIGEYSEALLVMVLYRIGEWFQDRAVDRSRRSIGGLMDICPDYANLLRSANAGMAAVGIAKPVFGETCEAAPSDISEENSKLSLSGSESVKVDPEELCTGDIILIKPGERVPADCVVIEGSSRIDTAALTGEALPADVGPSSALYSGSINLDGLITAKVLMPAEESTASRILELVEEAADNKARAENFITKFARVYTPIVCALAVVCAVLPPLIINAGDPLIWKSWVYRALEFLIISCPCALVISIPLAFFAGIGGASSKGVLIKGGNYLEALSRADTVVFDKTGTLTRGVFKVVAVHPSDCDEARLLELASLAESFSNHPIARSLADACGGSPDKSRVQGFTELAGKGVLAKVDGREVAAGNRRIMEHIGCAYHDCDHPGTRVHVALEGKYMGHIIISDELKSDSKSAVQGLSALGLRSVMLTGDKEDMAKLTASELGINEYHSELMPQDKVRIVEELIDGASKASSKRRASLAFVGDGINDAPVLARADVGIAMGGMGSAAAVEAADIVLMNDKPSDVALAVRHSKRIMNIIYQDIVLSLGIKLIVLAAAALGYSPMWLAVFADTGVCILAILNSMRGLKIKGAAN